MADGVSLLISEYPTPRVARAISVAATTINAWRQRHGLWGGGSSNRQTRYQFAFVEVCVAALIADLTRHGLPLADAIAVATEHQEAFVELVRDPEAERVVYLHRELGSDPMIVTTEDPSPWTVTTRIDLRCVLTDVIRGLNA